MAPAWAPSGDGVASPRRNNKGVRKLRKIFRDKKAISTILAALLMVVIVVVASVMVYAWSTGLLGTLMGGTPKVGQETLTLDTATMINGTRFSLNIRNSGSADASLTTYYAKDASGNTYQKTSWSGPTILVNTVRTVDVDISTLAGGSWTGTSYTFTAGYSYTIQIITAKGTSFNFIVPK